MSSRLSIASSDSESSIDTSLSRGTNLDKYLNYRSKYSNNFIYDSDKVSKSGNNTERIVQSRISEYYSGIGSGKDPDGFPPKKPTDQCLKCLLKMDHKKCQYHKYIRVGGGYRHGYYFVQALLQQIELQKQREEMLKRRLEAIAEGNVRAIKTYIRTKSGRLIEKIIYLNEEDYRAFMDAQNAGKDPKDILAKYMTKDEMENLDSYDPDEQQAIKTYIRTKSGRLIEKIIYMSKKEFEAMQRGELDPNEFLRKKLGLKSGEKLEGWKESKMKMITTKIRTKSGRIIEKQIMISEEDYEKLMKGGNLDDIMKKYMKDDPGAKLVGWEKAKKPGMKVVKTYIRTKSGRLIEKIIMMTEDEYREFEKSKGDPNFLKKYLDLAEGETIEGYEKQSTVYEGSDDEEVLKKAKPGQTIKDKDGNEYEVVVDPLTGKKYKRLIKKAGDKEPVYKTKDGRIITEKDIKKRKDMKQGKRNPDSDSEYSYKSFVSAGGTRHVRRRKKNADGTRGDSESYHSSQDEDGKARRRNRRRDRKHGAESAHSYYSVISEGGTRHVRRRKRNADGTRGDSESYHSADSAVFAAAEKSIKKQKKLAAGIKGDGEDSDVSIHTEVSEGGTKRRVMRRRIRDEHGNVVGHSKPIEVDESGKPIKRGGNDKKGKKHGSDSEFSYYSEETEGGTKYKKKKKRIRDKFGNVVGYGKSEDYSSSDEEERKNKKKKRGGSNSDHSYYTETSEGGTRRVMKKKKIKDKFGNVIGYEDPVEASSSEKSFITVSDGKGGKMKVANPKKKGKKYSAVFSDATTDSDIVREKLKNMTEEEKKKYLEERKKRAEEREQKRKEKYGDKYEEMKKIYEKKKEEYKEKVKAAKAAEKFKDGNEADTESEVDPITGQKKKKKKGGPERPDSSSTEEVIRDKDGNIIKKIKRDKHGNIIEEEYDKDGKLVSRKKKDKDGNVIADSSDDSDYFERDEHGNLRLKRGKKKIDLKNISKEQLLALGIDPNLPKSEIERLLREKFGDDIEILYGKKKIGSKNVDDLSDTNTDKLADNSDVDIDTVKPGKRERLIAKRMGDKLQEHIKKLIENANKKGTVGSETDSKIDFLSAYRLVDPQNLPTYSKFFAIEDHDDMDGIINHRGCVVAMNNLKRTGTIKNLTEKQMQYIFLALGVTKLSDVTFRMFSVIAALGERMTKLDKYCQELLDISDLLDIERKMKFYTDLFFMNERSEFNPNFVTVESISINLMAGGLKNDQRDFIISKLHPNQYNEISFIDFLSYIPLFMSFHDNINNNPLDMSDNKYTSDKRRRGSIQADMNPLGYSISRDTQFYKQHYLTNHNPGSQIGSKSNSRMNIQSITDNSPELTIVGRSKNSINRYDPLPGIVSPKQKK